MTERKIVLASGSPRRKELLERAGLKPVIIPSGKDEDCRASSPAAVVKALSAMKAKDIAAGQEKGTVVIGADTIVWCGGEILGKPADEADAVRMIRGLQDGTHYVYTGVTIIVCGEAEQTFFEKTAVSVYPMTEDEILQYVKSGEPMDKAGAYGIQGRFGAYIRRISGDYTNVVGLPLGRTMWEMKQLLK